MLLHSFKLCQFHEALRIWTALCRGRVWEILSLSLRTIIQNITFIPWVLASPSLLPSSSTSSVGYAERTQTYLVIWRPHRIQSVVSLRQPLNTMW